MVIDWFLNKTVEKLLGDIPKPEDLDKYIEQLQDKKSDIRVKAARSLASLKDIKAEQALIEALTDPERKVRRAVVHALAEINSQNASADLIKRLDDEDTSVVKTTIKALINLEDKAAIEPLTAKITHDNEAIRAEAVVALLELDSPDAETYLLNACNDKSAVVRSRAVGQLDKAEGPAIIEAVIRALQDQDVFVRHSAAVTCRSLHAPELVAPAIEALDDEDEGVRCQLVMALGEMQDEKAIEPLITATKDRDVSDFAFEALGKFHNTRATSHLLSVIEQEKNSEIKAEAIRGLIGHKDPDLYELFVSIFETDKDDNVALQSARVLAHMKTEQSLSYLAKALDDKSTMKRINAISALGDIKEQSVIPKLQDMAANDKDEEVREEAELAIEEIMSEGDANNENYDM